MSNALILVIGGAGYIGSHMVKYLLDKQHQLVILDNLSTGYQCSILGGEFIQGNMGDEALLDYLFNHYNFTAVMHFASHIEISESIQNPIKYYQNNFINTIYLLNKLINYNIKYFIFSSSAAIFGEPQYIPIDEQHPKNPLSPYGRSKWMVEQVLEDYAKAYDFKFVSLRYFNAAGAEDSALIGERHDPESHLIPLVLQTASGRKKSITIFGRDYNTPDGTCIRDYVHVNDLCQAHLLALNKLLQGGESGFYNLGNGQGFSVQEVIDIAKKITQRNITVINGNRRAGDPGILVADANLVKKELHWQPQYSSLEAIIAHAWRWEQKYIQRLEKLYSTI